MIGLGCMRLSTAGDRDEERAVAVIHAALDAGATLVDTADAYSLDERDTGHNERLVARALREWKGDRSQVTVATKGGMRRPKGAWVPDGRAKHLRDACHASRAALGIETIDLYQLHVVDPKTSIETSVRGLARLQEEGAIRDIGLCNVTVSQIRTAQSIAPIASVQVSLSPLDDENLRNGVVEYCQENGIRLLAYRPLGGERRKRLAKDVVLSHIASRYQATNEEVALGWLLSFGESVVPLPGATRVETATSLGRASALTFDPSDRDALDAQYSGRLLRVPRAERQPSANADGDVVIVMGMPGAGKTVLATELEANGYERLNRDAIGGSLGDLVPRLDELLAYGNRRVVLDNTYPSRKSRNEVIETAWSRGVPVRCIWLATGVADAQINTIHRMIGAHGSLPTPGDIPTLGKKDARFLSPDAQFRYERTLEPPSLDEGFTSLDARGFIRREDRATGRALILDFDDLVGANAPALHPDDVLLAGTRAEIIARFREDGFELFIHAWRPQLGRGETTVELVDACIAKMLALLGADAGFACCPHDVGPPICWCRKPIPGSVIAFAVRRDISLTNSIVVGSSAADRTMAQRIGAEFVDSASFFSSP